MNAEDVAGREWFSRLAAKARDAEEKAMDLLEELIQFPSVAARDKTATGECAAWVKNQLDAFGLRSSIFETDGSPVVFGERNVGASSTLLFYHHYDVQPEDPLDLWKSPPFELDVREDRIFGRGAVDNKGPLVATLLGIQLVEEDLGELPVNVKLVVEGEEEVGSRNLPKFAEANKEFLRADGSLMELCTCTPGLHSEIYGGSKGMVYFDLVTRGPPWFPRTDVHSGFAGVVPNPIWYLVAALNTIKDRDENILIDGLEEMVRPLAAEDSEVLGRYRGDMEERVKTDYGLDRTVLDRTGLEFLEAVFMKPTVTICGVSGGYQGPGSKSIVPSSASAKLEIRLVPDMTAEETERLLRDHLSKHGFPDIEVIRTDVAYDPAKTPIDHPFIGLVDSLAKEASAPAHANLFPMAFGTGPGYLFAPFAPTCLCLSSAELRGTNMHAPNENWPLTSFFNSIAFGAAVMERMGRPE